MTDNPPRYTFQDSQEPNWLLQVAMEKLKSQRAREKYFPASILRDLGWNIMLDLFVHDLLGRQVSVSSACLSSGGPATTALRWLQVLEKDGLIVRVPDDEDRRKVYVAVTDSARRSITRWLRHDT